MKTVFRPEYQALIQALRTIREEKGITQQELSKKMGENYDHSLISKIENFDRRIDIFELLDYAKAMGLRFNKIIEILKSVLSNN